MKSALATINGNMAREVSRQRMKEEDKAAALKRISTTETLDGLSDCDLVIEAATEKEEVKRRIFTDLCPALKPEAIVATNTSSISITRLAASTDRPEQFIGIHFMNPVPLHGAGRADPRHRDQRRDVRGVEGVRRSSSARRIAVSEDFPAFIVNRILLPMINEAIYTLYEGVGNVEAIDTAMKLGANHPMGPLELADFIGLDTCLSVMQVLHEGLADSKYRPCPLLVKYVEAGWLGRKIAARLLRLPRRKAGADALDALRFPFHSRVEKRCHEQRHQELPAARPQSAQAEGRAAEGLDRHPRPRVRGIEYKMNPDRGYNPPDSTLDDLKHLHKTLGVDRVVFTQPSTYGTDNSAILDGMSALNAQTPDRARCVVAITMDITDKELAALNDRARAACGSTPTTRAACRSGSARSANWRRASRRSAGTSSGCSPARTSSS